jgi:hypothetical protein
MTMTNDDIQLLSNILEEKVRGVHIKMDAEFSVLGIELKQIKEQVTKTNNRVTHLEENVAAIPAREIKHVIDCPNIKKIDDINVDLREYRMFKKYPKIAIGVIIGACLFIIFTTFELQFKMNKSLNRNIVEIEKLDSLNKK